MRANTHSVVIGYIAWIFGFMGAHRFYYGKRVTAECRWSFGPLFGSFSIFSPVAAE